MFKKREVKSVKTATELNLHSIPQSHRSKYLDLFRLGKQKGKLITENATLRCKLEKNLDRLGELQKQIEEIEQVDQPRGQVKVADPAISDANPEEKFKLRTMKLRY